ncbi:gelsolin [Apodospora peruviana]|uniref:Gelsolin n=1 Tax=Apodospora peruviana TaxID=516989 RepID=A0AAE0HWC0_9PEZI|nr:gelsolin [Apodospora peruviana]
MAPNAGLVHLNEYDIKDSNVELIGTDLDHKVKYNSAASEPAWNDGRVGVESGLFVWRIEDFTVVPIPKANYGQFFEGDSYIVLHSWKTGSNNNMKLSHDIFFWLGAKTSQDEAGTAAYKTVELDEFLHGAATQYRELQASPSDGFVALFPRLTVRRGGIASGFRHVEEAEKEEVTTLLRVFKHAASGRADSIVVLEVEPTWQSLDEGDVFVLDKGDKIWVWQGKKCSPMEKAKAAQVVHDMTLAKHVDVEVLSQNESRSRTVVSLLGGAGDEGDFHCPRPMGVLGDHARPKKLFRLSDASGQLTFDLVKQDSQIKRSDLDGSDVFLLDDAGKEIWVWEGGSASRAEKAMWLKVAQAYIRKLQGEDGQSDAYLTPIAKVKEGNESAAFGRAIQAA